MSLAVRVRNLSKMYRLGKSLRGRLGETFLALNDVNFDVHKGECLGILGRNGAGKSTLAKIICRIAGPSTGKVEVFGQVASLLEVGTGFHPELTGRENVFLNGAVLGMRRKEIARKFDDIVSFSGIERFIDTPVKVYSSGMYIRLAFAVAAHLDPEIMILDEVLSVGDIGFQQKCLSKMESFTHEHRTVLLVSHNMSAIRNYCKRALLLDEGKLVFDGKSSDAIARYYDLMQEQNIRNEQLRERLSSCTGAVRINELKITDTFGHSRTEFSSDEMIRISLQYGVMDDVKDLAFVFGLRSEHSHELIASTNKVLSTAGLSKGNEGTIVLELSGASLRPNAYRPFFWLGNNKGIAFDKIDYAQLGKPPIVIQVQEFSRIPDQGFFPIDCQFSHIRLNS